MRQTDGMVEGLMIDADEERGRVEAAWDEYLQAHEQDRQFRQLAEAGALSDPIGRWALADRAAELGLSALNAYMRRLRRGES